jgi:hypothetical protein
MSIWTDLTCPTTAPEDTPFDAMTSTLVEIVIPDELPEVTLPKVKPNTVTVTLEFAGMLERETVKTN